MAMELRVMKYRMPLAALSGTVTADFWELFINGICSSMKAQKHEWYKW